MSNVVTIGRMKIESELFYFVTQDVLPNSGVEFDAFWAGFERTLEKFIPQNIRLLENRKTLQTQIDVWHKSHFAEKFDEDEYETFLRDIGYLVDEGRDFQIETNGLDPEVSNLAGAQLVVPISNARFAVNAVNARWGSLYDALYGSDIIKNSGESAKGYDESRGAKVVAWGRDFLNKTFVLQSGRFHDVTGFRISKTGLEVLLNDGEITQLTDETQFSGYCGNAEAPSCILLFNNGLHVEIHIDKTHTVGKNDIAGISDIWMEAALSTILDFEDSVAVVNASEKTAAYKNWLGLVKGDLRVEMQKNGKQFYRVPSSDREYKNIRGQAFKRKGRSLMLVRNVGLLMTTDAVLFDGQEIPEGILDAFITALIGRHDYTRKHAPLSQSNARDRAIYIVKPKMHGPEEVAFSNDLFSAVEEVLSLPKNTLKMGIMDEERRTSVNLKECIRAAKNRVFFINTGFLDRTGDEIHTAMYAGAFIPKGKIKHSVWIDAYEKRNVQIGLQCGFKNKAQIGKGMWAMPDEMAQMMDAKIQHPLSGATSAWVPSPTAAVLHSTHYHEVNVADVQNTISQKSEPLKNLLSLALMGSEKLTKQKVQIALDNSAQSILGYVVRWINDGIGCSKVPDIKNIGLMEDRATLRISSQHIANWLCHDICDKAQILSTFKRMAKVVDAQNQNVENYKTMADDFENDIAFNTACALVFKGGEQPSGYTEPLLYKMRKQYISKNSQHNVVELTPTQY